ncbi:MAG: plasmid pRiA4b ORF-3 family protein [Clostridiales bacterium]|jgi:predicted Zn-ribbon and HTH transcriptional regulator|nr:plasmid pRiA4b ORF-3 family protein [Clostridiales bacterium]
MSGKSDAVQGNCFICGKTAGKTAIKNHVLKEHNSGEERCYLFKAEGAYVKDYWLFFTAPIDTAFSAVDQFLRRIWCDCCGHLSEFSSGGQKVGKTRKLSAFAKGDRLLYEYDFGSTTEIILTVVDEILRPQQREKIRLLARNEPLPAVCDTCGAPAAHVNAWEGSLVCEACAENIEDEAALLPLVNSPRCGECGYTGALDRWIFDPAKPFSG